MSGAFDKKIEKAKRREERILKEQKDKRRTRIIAIVVIIVFALLLSAALFLNSKYVRQSLPAISVGGVSFSSSEFDYLYMRTYKDYEQSLKDYLGEEYAAAYLPSSDVSHSSQIYNPETGETWADYLTNYTMSQIVESAKYYNAAVADGFVLPADAIEAIDSEMSSYLSYAEMYNTSIDNFISTYIGRYMNEKNLRRMIEFMYTVSYYNESVHDSFEYSDERLAACYLENKDSMDSITYRVFLVEPETLIKEDYESEEEYQAAEEAALAEASEKARDIKSRIFSEEDFINEAEAYGAEDYSSRTYPGSSLSSDYNEWLLGEERQSNDVEVFDITAGTYVVYFIDRDPNEYLMTEMRQILAVREELSPADYPGGADDPDYLAAMELADRAALEKAQMAETEFVDGGGKEEAFIQAIDAGLSDDTTPGGYYDLITKNAANNKMVPEIEEWLFAPERKAGDYKIVRTEAFGYHLLYFVGYGERYCDYLADTKLRDDDYTAWEESLETDEAVQHWAFMFRQIF